MDEEKRYSEYSLYGFLAIGLAAGLVAGMAIYAAAYPVFQSSEWAAWVQAIGSVSALGIAVWVASRQARLTREIHSSEARSRSMVEHLTQQRRAAERRSWLRAVVAIIENAAEHVKQIEIAVSGEPLFEGHPMSDVHLATELSHFRASVSALRAITLTDLRSYDAVHGVMGLANEAELIIDYLDRAEAAPHDDPDGDEEGWVGLVRPAAFRGLGYYAKAVAALGEKPNQRLTQYEDLKPV